MLPENKVAIVTGAGVGIGRETALLLARMGCRVVVNSLSEANAAMTCELIEAQGGEAAYCHGDVSDAQTASRVTACAERRFGGLDILVNNAGIVCEGTVESVSQAEFERSMGVNVLGVFLMCKYALPLLRARGGGSIVNNASVVALKGVRARAAYAASKGAVVALTKSMAADYILENIRVNVVCPGTTDTPSLGGRIANAQDPEKARLDFIARQPMGRLGTAQEIARAIVFAADSSFMTGSTLVVDGGMLL